MPSILIVDDDPTIRAMFSRALQSLGEVDQAPGGADALRMLAGHKYDVVLLDLHMPVIDGSVILQTLANRPGPNRETPIYIVTADTSEHARVKTLRNHAVFFLTKPVPIPTLIALVDATLKKAAYRARPASVATARSKTPTRTPPPAALKSGPPPSRKSTPPPGRQSTPPPKRDA
jgi:CheY-like chemotaxis protein